MKIRKKENSYNLVCFYPGRVPQKAISKSTVRTFIALANRKQGQSHIWIFDDFIFPCACFYICFQTFKQASHYIKDNRCISLSLKPVIFKTFFPSFRIICSRRKIIYTFYLFWWQNWKKYSVQAQARKV